MMYIPCDNYLILSCAIKSGRLLETEQQFLKSIENTIFAFAVYDELELLGCVYVRNFDDYYSLDGYLIADKPIRYSLCASRYAIDYLEELKQYPKKDLVIFYPVKFKGIGYLAKCLGFKKIDKIDISGIDYFWYEQDKIKKAV